MNQSEHIKNENEKQDYDQVMFLLRKAIDDKTTVIIKFLDKSYTATIRYVDDDDASFGFTDINGRHGSGLINKVLQIEEFKE